MAEWTLWKIIVFGSLAGYARLPAARRVACQCWNSDIQAKLVLEKQVYPWGTSTFIITWLSRSRLTGKCRVVMKRSSAVCRSMRIRSRTFASTWIWIKALNPLTSSRGWSKPSSPTPGTRPRPPLFALASTTGRRGAGAPVPGLGKQLQVIQARWFKPWPTLIPYKLEVVTFSPHHPKKEVSRFRARKMNGWNLRLHRWNMKIIWTKPSFSGSMKNLWGCIAIIPSSFQSTFLRLP